MIAEKSYSKLWGYELKNVILTTIATDHGRLSITTIIYEEVECCDREVHDNMANHTKHTSQAEERKRLIKVIIIHSNVYICFVYLRM